VAPEALATSGLRTRSSLVSGMITGVYVLLALWMTWPLAARMSDHVVDTVALHGPFGWLTLADTLLVVWALAWDAHALTSAPLALFDANVFHPARWALARSDHFLGNLPIAGPIYLLTDNPVLAHQALLLLTFPLSAITMYLAVARWTRSTAAGFIAGLMFGFGPWRVVQLAHVQLLATMYLPLLLLSAWATSGRGGKLAWWGLATCTTLQALCSVYLGLAAFVAAGAMVVGTWSVAPRGSWRGAARALIALGLAAAVVLALSLPYVLLQRSGAIPSFRGMAGGHLELEAARPLSTYLVHHRPASADGYYFLGWSCAILAVLGALMPARHTCRQDRMVRAGLLTVLAAGWLLSLGYAWRLPGGGALPMPLGWLAAVVPALGSIRAPLRLGVIVTLAAAALAGTGYARIERRVRSPLLRVALAAAVALLFLYEGVPRAVPLRRLPVASEIPPVYRWLVTQPSGPLLELPVGFVDHDFTDISAVRWQSTYHYLSTAHWRPLLNGYSGYPPESFFFLMAIARRLPAPDALQDLVDLSGLRWLIVHRGWLPAAARQSWPDVDRTDALVRRAAFGDDVIYEVRLAPRRDLRGLIRAGTRDGYTLSGLARAPLTPEAARGTLRDLDLPRTMLAGSMAFGVLSVENQSTQPWPGFDPAREGLVCVAYRWRRENGEITAGTVFTRLGRDLSPGDRMRLPFGVTAPPVPGRYELIVTLRQDGGPWFDEAGGIAALAPVEVRPWPARPGSTDRKGSP